MSKKDNYTILHPDQETIVAQCTPCGSGAIALIRISGKCAIAIATKISKLASGKKLSELQSHTIHFGWVMDEKNNTIDQVLFLLMHAPKTFTGQDTVEITCHNNQYIIENIINRAIECGARLAQNGEFTKRAFLSGKMDLLQAEAVNELIHSQTQTALKSSLAQLEGSLSSWITKIEHDLLKALSFSEASFEFIEDEEIEFGAQIKKILEKNLATIKTLKKTFNNQKQIREGIRIAIIGSVNAGKSSLFNILLNQKRAIVTNIAGTTRDAIESVVTRDGNNISLIDTAGLRETNNSIEKEGIGRSFDEAKKADIIILVFDSSRILSQQEAYVYKKIIDEYKQKIIFVANKCDIKTQDNSTLDKILSTPELIEISSLENKNINILESKIDQKIKTLFSQIESPFLLNKRQYNLLSGLENKLKELTPLITKNPDYEIVSYHLKDALSYLSEFTGKTANEKSIDLIFKEFCIGK
ncbi:tRNA uridine-5-carboxymethylaminomethyl(34) synthesis GTPase MnmE [Candidatus Dependentiae bacterium]